MGGLPKPKAEDYLCCSYLHVLLHVQRPHLSRYIVCFSTTVELQLPCLAHEIPEGQYGG